MKKILTILAISLSALLTHQIAIANPHFDNGQGYGRGNGPKFKNMQLDADSLDGIKEQRREREERGFKRLKQHKWQTGYVMPQHYRGDSYKVDYKDSQLPRPSRNQQWYKINNDYILVDADTNSIVSIRGM